MLGCKSLQTPWILLVPSFFSLAFSSFAFSSGFERPIQSTSSIGTAGATDYSGEDDPLIIQSNPAAIGAFLGDQFAFGLTGSKSSIKFLGGSRTLSQLPEQQAEDSATKKSINDACKASLFPSLSGTHEVDESLSTGWSLAVPYSSYLDHGQDWIGRYYGIKTDLWVLALDLGVSYRILDRLLIGLSIQAQQAKWILTGASNYAAISALRAADGQDDIISDYQGSSLGAGYRFGILYDIDQDWRVGFSFRSQVQHKSKGKLSFQGASTDSSAFAEGLSNGTAELMIDLPSSIGIGAHFQLLDELALSFSASRTNWSSLQDLTITYEDGSDTDLLGGSLVEDLKWKDVMALAIGATYEFDSNLTARSGLAYEQAPTQDAFRSPRNPEADHLVVGLGGRYRGDDWSIDLSYSYTGMKNPSLALQESAYPEALGRGNLEGKYKVSAHTVMLQYGMSIPKY